MFYIRCYHDGVLIQTFDAENATRCDALCEALTARGFAIKVERF